MKRFNKGFTLIELLIVIAVLGTLAVVVLIALNPVQQLARARDAGRDSSIAQLGRAMEARGTILGGQYPINVADTWIKDYLVDSGEINTVPGNATTSYTAGVVTNECGDAQGFCYDSTLDSFIIYTTAEAESNRSQCDITTEFPMFVYSSAAGRGGVYCSAVANPVALAFDITDYVK